MLHENEPEGKSRVVSSWQYVKVNIKMNAEQGSQLLPVIHADGSSYEVIRAMIGLDTASMARLNKL